MNLFPYAAYLDVLLDQMANYSGPFWRPVRRRIISKLC